MVQRRKRRNYVTNRFAALSPEALKSPRWTFLGTEDPLGDSGHNHKKVSDCDSVLIECYIGGYMESV